jgi:hypothetical protein
MGSGAGKQIGAKKKGNNAQRTEEDERRTEEDLGGEAAPVGRSASSTSTVIRSSETPKPSSSAAQKASITRNAGYASTPGNAQQLALAPAEGPKHERSTAPDDDDDADSADLDAERIIQQNLVTPRSDCSDGDRGDVPVDSPKVEFARVLQESQEKRTNERLHWLKSLGDYQEANEPIVANLKLSEKQREFFASGTNHGMGYTDRQPPGPPAPLSEPDIFGEIKKWNQLPTHVAMVAGAKMFDGPSQTMVPTQMLVASSIDAPEVAEASNLREQTIEVENRSSNHATHLVQSVECGSTQTSVL